MKVSHVTRMNESCHVFTYIEYLPMYIIRHTYTFDIYFDIHICFDIRIHSTCRNRCRVNTYCGMYTYVYVCRNKRLRDLPVDICCCRMLTASSADTATHCNTLQHTATHCNTLQHIATYWKILQQTAYRCCYQMRVSKPVLLTLQHTTTHNTLQHTATHCNTLRHTTTHCNTLQHTYRCYFRMCISKQVRLTLSRA